MNSKLKKIKRIVVLFIVMSLIVSGCSKAKKEENNGIDSVELKSNQEIVVCKITAIDGNEIEYTVVKEQNTSDIKRDKMPSSSAAPDKGNGEKPSGERPSGAPDMNDRNGSSGDNSSQKINQIKKYIQLQRRREVLQYRLERR